MSDSGVNKYQLLSKTETVIFASGDLFGGGAQVLIAFFYLIFLTDVVGLRPALAGIVILISKVWDAISDPLMGVITDNTRTQRGRRKPYFLAGFFAIIIAVVLLWYPVKSDNDIVLFIYVLFSFLFYSTVSTMVMVPYAAMSSEISTDYKDRNTINGTRLVFSQLSSLFAAVLPMEIIKIMPSVETGYIAMSIFFGIMYAVPYLFIFLKTHERISFSEEKSTINIKQFTQPFQIKSFRILISMYLFSFLTMDIVSTVFAYYMNYFLKRPSELNYVLGAMLITQICCVPLVVYFSNRLGKAQTLKVSVVLWLIAVSLLAMLSPSWATYSIYLIAILMGSGIVGCIVVPWLMYPDVTDVGEFVFGKRCSGSFGGIMTFLRKFSAAIGIFVVSQILDLSGYKTPMENSCNGITNKILQEQPESVIIALKIIIIIIPLILLSLVFLFANKYPLTIKIQKRMNEYLEWKRGNLGNNPLNNSELAELKDKLI